MASFDEPHGPYLCPKKYVDMYADYKLPRPGNFDDTLEDKPEFQRLWARPFRHLTEDPEFRASHKEFSAVILMWIMKSEGCWKRRRNMRRMQ